VDLFFIFWKTESPPLLSMATSLSSCTRHPPKSRHNATFQMVISGVNYCIPLPFILLDFPQEESYHGNYCQEQRSDKKGGDGLRPREMNSGFLTSVD